MAAGPIDCCTECKLDMYFIGRLSSEISPKMAHVIMGALRITEDDGRHGCDRGVFDDCLDHQKSEVELVKLVLSVQPDVVKNDLYSTIPTVKEALK